MKPIKQFRVWFEPGKEYARVYVWKDRRTMQDWLGHSGFEAICVQTDKFYPKTASRRWERDRRMICELHFTPKSLRMGIIVHECGHATIQWCRKKRIKPLAVTGGRYESRGNERFCWVLGNVARQIVLKTRNLLC